VKLIAGKIIPAIATTTAMVVGAVGIEIIKFLLNKKATAYKNITANLALPLWVFNDPLEAIVNDSKEFDPIMCGPIKVVPGSTHTPMQNSRSGRRST
jgi:ubiquitin-activating enzyme E1